MRHPYGDKDYKSLQYHTISVILTQKQLKDLICLQDTYDMIFADYMIDGFRRLFEGKRPLHGRAYVNRVWDDKDNYFMKPEICELMSKTMATDILEFGENMLYYRSRYIRENFGDKDSRKTLRAVLYRKDIWKLYSLASSYMYIRSTCDIETQIFGGGRIRLPGYGDLKLDQKEIKQFPMGNSIYSARMYITWDKESKSKTGAKLSVSSFPADRDDDGFFTLHRWMTLDQITKSLP